jgi:apolipoprotein N-acyltransferase
MRPLLLAVVGGVIFALTAPPTNIYPAVVVGLALLAASLSVPEAAPGFWRAFGRGAAWGTAAGLVGLRFVPVVIQRFTNLGTAASLLALVLLAAAQSLIWAIGAGVTAVLRRRAHLPFEIAFGAGVLVTLTLPSIFVWSPAGLVSPWPALVQLADVIGERGVSVIFAIAAAWLARAASSLARRQWREARRVAAGVAATFIVLAVHGAVRMRSVARESETLPAIRIGLVDQAVPPLDRWNAANYPAILRTLRTLTSRLEAQGADLTIWPEAAYPYEIPHDARVAPRGRGSLLGRDVHGPLLVGLITQAPPVRLPSGDVEQNSYNSATLVTPDGALTPTSDKLELLWFGEMVPGGTWFPWLRRLFQRSGGLVPGDAPFAQELAAPASGAPPVRMAVLNCYEDTLPSLGNKLARTLRPQLLVNITNDAWFDGTAEPELHARLGTMRAIELRTDVVRAVNLGVTSWVDAAGVVRARYASEAPGTLLVTPAVGGRELTFYARWGDAPAYGLLAFLTMLFARPAPTRRRGAKVVT